MRGIVLLQTFRQNIGHKLFSRHDEPFAKMFKVPSTQVHESIIKANEIEKRIFHNVNASIPFLSFSQNQLCQHTMVKSRNRTAYLIRNVTKFLKICDIHRMTNRNT